MILPIYIYGQPVLKKVAAPIDRNYKGLEQLVENMWETMYNAHGVGLAAPQIGKSIRLFIVDTVQFMNDEVEFEGIKRVFINAEKLDESGDPWEFEEGCLSIPEIRGEVERPRRLHLRYRDLDWEMKEEVFDGMNARVIQHEYDHIDGILFTEHLKPLKRRLIQRRLDSMRKGNLTADYAVRVARK